MPAGLQCWDESGRMFIDTSYGCARLIDYFTVTANGSRTFAAGTGQLVAACVYLGHYALPDIAVSGNTVTWTFPGPNSLPTEIIVFRY